MWDEELEDLAAPIPVGARRRAYQGHGPFPPAARTSPARSDHNGSMSIEVLPITSSSPTARRRAIPTRRLGRDRRGRRSPRHGTGRRLASHDEQQDGAERRHRGAAALQIDLWPVAIYTDSTYVIQGITQCGGWREARMDGSRAVTLNRICGAARACRRARPRRRGLALGARPRRTPGKFERRSDFGRVRAGQQSADLYDGRSTATRCRFSNCRTRPPCRSGGWLVGREDQARRILH